MVMITTADLVVCLGGRGSSTGPDGIGISVHPREIVCNAFILRVDSLSRKVTGISVLRAHELRLWSSFWIDLCSTMDLTLTAPIELGDPMQC